MAPQERMNDGADALVDGAIGACTPHMCVPVCVCVCVGVCVYVCVCGLDDSVRILARNAVRRGVEWCGCAWFMCTAMVLCSRTYFAHVLAHRSHKCVCCWVCSWGACVCGREDTNTRTFTRAEVSKRSDLLIVGDKVYSAQKFRVRTHAHTCTVHVLWNPTQRHPRRRTAPHSAQHAVL